MIFTSRYSNQTQLTDPRYIKIGITLGKPKFALRYQVDATIKELAPSGAMFHIYDRKVFTEQYFTRMNKLGVKGVQELLEPYVEEGKDLVLLCYEDLRKPGEWCHRQVFAEWWEKETGVRIQELELMSAGGVDRYLTEFEEKTKKPDTQTPVKSFSLF